MPSSSSTQEGATAYYSILRFNPDPVRDESVNVGLFLVDRRGRWARFDGEVPRGLLRSMKRGTEASAIEKWIARTKDTYGAVGETPLLPAKGKITLHLLQQWSAEFGGALQLSEPKVAVGDTYDKLWKHLYGRLIELTGEPAAALPEVGARAPHLTAADERERISAALVRTMRTWPNFDRKRIISSPTLFEGLRYRHQADVAVVNGKVMAIAKVLPVVHGTEQDVIVARALLVDAARDLRKRVAKLALYDEPPPDRLPLLTENIELLKEVEVDVVARPTFPELERRFAERFFPEA